MFEEDSYEAVLNRMLGQIPDDYDKRPSSPIYNALAPAAMEVADMYVAMNLLFNECFGDTASYHYLAKRAAERGIFPEEAQKAVLRGEFVPESMEIPLGERFNLNDLNYVVQSKMEDGAYRVQCETAGAIGNQQLGEMTPIGDVPGLEAARITEVLIPGEEEEDVEVFRNRYFASFRSQAFGGNKAQYLEEAKRIPGVGGVKVHPAWNGGGTVKLVITDSRHGAPSNTLVGEVQNYFDPGRQGTGDGMAPIGHTVTVVGVEPTEITVSLAVVYTSGADAPTVLKRIGDAIREYFLFLSGEWENSQQIVVRASRIEALVLDVDGVLDVGGTKLNGVRGNMELDGGSIPILKAVEA